jgi:hypothetical protein
LILIVGDDSLEGVNVAAQLAEPLVGVSLHRALGAN